MKIAALMSAFVLTFRLSAAAAVPADPDTAAFNRLQRAVTLEPAQTAKAKAVCESYAPRISELKAARSAAITAQSEALISAHSDAIAKAFPEAERSTRGFMLAMESAKDPKVAAKLKSDLAKPLERNRKDAARIEAMNVRIDKLIGERDQDLAALLNAGQSEPFQSFKAAMQRERDAARIKLFVDIWARNSRTSRVGAMQALTAEVTSPWTRALLEKDADALKPLLDADFQGSSWAGFVPSRNDGLIQEWALKPGAQAGAEATLDGFRELLARFSSVESADLDILEHNAKQGVDQLSGRLSIRGIDAATKRRMEFSSLADVALASRAGTRKIQNLRFHGGHLLLASKAEPMFEDKTRAAGLDAVPVLERNEAIRRGGYAVAAQDYNADGCVDLYVGMAGPGMLLKGDCKGRFTDSTAQAAIGQDKLVKSAVLADFNNDGRQDLLVVRFEYSADKQIALYEGMPDGKFRLAENFNFAGFAKYDYSLPMPMAVGDFNGDGKLDFYVGFPGKLDFTTLAFEDRGVASDPRNRYNGHPQGLFVNLGGFKFEDKTDYALYQNDTFAKRMGTAALFPHSAVAFDADGDGKQDILVVDDRKNPNPFFHNNGDGTFRQTAAAVGLAHPQWGMSVAVGDFSNSGLPDLYMTNVHFRESVPEGREGNRFFRNRGDGTFEDVTEKSGMRFAGEATGGASALDFDNDGRQDILVVNGLWTGPKAESIAGDFLRANDGMRYYAEALKSAGLEAPIKLGPGNIDLIDQGQAIMRMLKDSRDEAGVPIYSLGGRQRNRLYRNNGDGTFTDVAYVAGLDGIADGYVAAIADVYGDGGQDIVLRNADPGTLEHVFPAIQLFKNNASKARRHLSLVLEGGSSNKDAVGSRANVWGQDDLKQYRELIANNGASQDERKLHFGLGEKASVKKLEVRWPSGAVQTFKNVGAGDYKLKEGGALERIVHQRTMTAQNP